ncbi:MAG: pyridoxal-dependent decarboxylase [Bacteroidota bacterium]
MNSDDKRYLSWFLGPKAENSEIFLTALNTIFQDYIHWRRNYHPDDNVLISKKMQRDFVEENDSLSQNIVDMMSSLRRNFPFYSPRYIAHMLSDITMPSMLGYFAGMLYNSNNVTPEASPVAVEWEIEACNEILKMVGFKPSPNPPLKDDPIAAWEIYQKELKEEFGWAHITSGGTVANIEAIWVARIVKYFPLAVQEISLKYGLDITIKRPDKTISDIKTLTKHEAINIKPNESIFLYAKLINALSAKKQVSVREASDLSSKLLSESKYSLTNNLGNIFTEFPPVLFTSGAAHYSVKKAADILGIGKDNVIIVDTDSSFKMDCKDLENKIHKAVKDGKHPVAVIAVGGTTEEGAVDPMAQIVSLREELEKNNQSFWLHIDSAWGGYINTIFNFDEEDEFQLLLNKISNFFSFSLGQKRGSTELANDLIEGIMSSIVKKIDTEAELLRLFSNSSTQSGGNLKNKSLPEFEKRVKVFEGHLNELKSLIPDDAATEFTKEKKRNFINKLKNLLINHGDFIFIAGASHKKTQDSDQTNLQEETRNEPQITMLSDILNLKNAFVLAPADYKEEIPKFVQDTISFKLDNFRVDKLLQWGNIENIESFLSFKFADSITIDPHKLGYIQYPCGLVSFRNDRIRHLIMQRAPYITSSAHSVLLHTPPKHIKNLDFSRLSAPDEKDKEFPYDDYKIGIDAFAPFMLEGSKPGAAATALWLSSKLIPLNRKNHGLIIKSSLLAARELFEWLFTWNKIHKEAFNEDIYYEFKTFGTAPDTNVVVFCLKDKFNETIHGMNQLSLEVYKKFTIQAELGSKEHSYSQPFFLSKTTMDEEYYKYKSFKSFFDECGLRESEKHYKEEGLIVLRATVMNPYITPIRQNTKQNLIAEFILELHKAANKACKEILSRKV